MADPIFTDAQHIPVTTVDSQTIVSTVAVSEPRTPTRSQATTIAASPLSNSFSVGLSSGFLFPPPPPPSSYSFNSGAGTWGVSQPSFSHRPPFYSTYEHGSPSNHIPTFDVSQMASQFANLGFTSNPLPIPDQFGHVIGHSGASATPPLHGMVSPFTNIWSLDVTKHVTQKLSTVEDYLSWHIQFKTFLFSHQLFGFVDGSNPPPSSFVIDNIGVQRLNPIYSQWLRVDQCIKSWLFATLTREVLIEVHNLTHSFEIWQKLQSRFNTASLARALDLKRMLTNLHKPDNQSMEDYLRSIKIIADNLASIQAPVSDLDLIQYTLAGLNSEYEPFITTVMYSPEHLTFDDLRTKLTFYEQRVRFLHDREQGANTTVAFMAQHGSNGAGGGQIPSQNRDGASATSRPGGRNSGRNNNGKGRGRGNGRTNKPRQGRVGNRNWSHNQQPQQARSVYMGAVSGNVASSYYDVTAFPATSTNVYLAGSSNYDGTQSSEPNVVCQLCHLPGHKASNCPIRYEGRPIPNTPAYASFNVGEANENMWYPDSAAASHMTPYLGQDNGGGSTSGA